MSSTPPIPPVRVSRIEYRVVSDSSGHDFSHAEPIDIDLDGWSGRMEASLLTAVPALTFGSREDAREQIEPLLASWAQSAFLARALPFHFAYEGAYLEVINPDPHNVFVFPESATALASVDIPTIVIGHSRFPPPDPSFARSSLTDLLAERLRALEERRAELPAIANLVSTLLERAFGSRQGCQTTLAISSDVMSTLNRLSSQFDPVIGRKASSPNPQPLTPQELAWLRAVVFRLAYRVGEHASNKALTTITRADFPSIP